MIQRDLTLCRVDGNNLAAQLVYLEILVGGRLGSRLLPRMAPSQRDSSEQCGKK
jgi:hypothetical protein